MELFNSMAQSIVDGDVQAAESLAQQALAAGIDPLDAINQGFIVGVNQVGEAYSSGEAFLPELVMAGEAMKAAVAVLEPEMTRRGAQRDMLGKVVIGTIQGDIHDIGKTLVGTMLAASGFDVTDLGANVEVSNFIDTARELDADIIAVSALLTTTMVRQRDVVIALDELRLRPRIKVMIGGAPVTTEWVQTIGADGYSEDAIGAVEEARRLMGR